MSYFRRSMGDGPITDPSQVDDSILVGEVPPTRVDCSKLPEDSPFRKPGQVCADAPLPGNDLWDAIKGAIGVPPTGTGPSTPDASVPPLLIIGGLGLAAYYWFGKKKR